MSAEVREINDIETEVGKGDWDAICCSTRTKHVTPSGETLELPDSWEAELLGRFHALDVLAAYGHLWELVPEALKAI